MKKLFMLDTCICSFIMREQPLTVLTRLQQEMNHQNQIVISAITYAEMLYGAQSKKASPKHAILVEEFVKRLDDILPWDVKAVTSSAAVRKQLFDQGTPIGNNDIAIAGHALSVGAILVTNNTREFCRVNSLRYEDWVN